MIQSSLHSFLSLKVRLSLVYLILKTVHQAKSFVSKQPQTAKFTVAAIFTT
jgi:hypothetical protein